jgi:glutathione synthase/RimK-type ligase-like ATP-grasp enzyme
VLTLAWGLPGDTPLAQVVQELDRLGAPVWLLDQRNVLDTELELCTDRRVAGWIRVGDRRLDLTEVTAAYVRPYDACELPRVAAQGTDGDAGRHASAVDQAIACWLEVTDALVVNRLSAMAGNASKPWQSRRIQAAGFAVPETVVTTEPRTAHSFWDRHEQVIYKSVSGVRSRVARLRPDDAGRLADVATCPTQLQRFVPGTDVRVHVVGRRVFATEVACDADDYRYAAVQGHPEAELAPFDLPARVEDGCRRLTAELGLTVAGIDLRITPEGDWYCFEVNPSPAFSFYQHATGQPIARAIACLLAAAGPVRSHARTGGRP